MLDVMSATNGNGQPTKLDGTGRDPKTGRWLPGHVGIGGRPPAIDFRAVAEARCKADGTTIEEALADVFAALLSKAQAGDVQAIRVLFDKCTIDDGVELKLKGRGDVSVVVVTGVPDTTHDAPRKLVVTDADLG